MSWLHCVLIIENWCWSLWGLKGLRWNPLGNWVSSVFKGSRVFSLTWPALCKFIGTKENICIRKQFNSQRIGLGHQHGCRFIVLGHQYGRRDVMWKHFILFCCSLCLCRPRCLSSPLFLCELSLVRSCGLFTVPYFSVRLSRSSAYRQWRPFCH